MSADRGAEQAVLGAMMLDASVIDEIAGIIGGGDFAEYHHELIFNAIAAQHADGKPVDPIAVRARLAADDDAVRCGEAPYLLTLIGEVPTAAQGPYYADIVARHAQLRRLNAVATRLHGMATNPGTDIDDVPALYTAAITELTAALETTGTAGIPSIGDLFASTLDAIEHPEKRVVVPTGIHDLDAVLGGGLQPGQLALIAARPSVGKSVAGLGLGRHASVVHKSPVLLWTGEMSADEITRRLIAAESGVELHRIQSGELGEFEWGKISRIADRVMAAPLQIDATPAVSLDQLRAMLRSMQRAGAPAGLVVLDYLQLMTPPKAENREQRIAALSRGLKSMAQEYQIPIVALAQLNRESEKRQDKVPATSDLRESGSLEQEADIVVLIHREDMYVEESPRTGEADFIVAKNRSGPRCKITVAFQGQYARFVDMAAEWTPHAALRSVA